MPLKADEFIRRFLLHVLPDRFVKIRHYGLLGNRCRKEKLAACRRFLACTPKEDNNDKVTLSGPLCQDNTGLRLRGQPIDAQRNGAAPASSSL
jgi:hypothetical protein